MSDNQKALFLAAEGDAWYERNQQALAKRDAKDDAVTQVMQNLQLQPKHILEVGCADGWRLRGLAAAFGAQCAGVEPSAAAVAAGKKLTPAHDLRVGTAEKLEFADGSFDTLIYGFCLTYCDRKDLFRVAQEGDRVLKDGGHIVVYDFCTDVAYRNAYAHKPGYYCYKMKYAELFTWNPAYSVVHHQLVSHGGPSIPDSMDERIGITVLRKQLANAWPDNPFKK